jgi:transcriptional regulator with XRE-family HTH domain
MTGSGSGKINGGPKRTAGGTIWTGFGSMQTASGSMRTDIGSTRTVIGSNWTDAGSHGTAFGSFRTVVGSARTGNGSQKTVHGSFRTAILSAGGSEGSQHQGLNEKNLFAFSSYTLFYCYLFYKRNKSMKQSKNLNEIASRLRTLRLQKKLPVKQMAAQLGISPNGYRKYERSIYLPPLHLQVILAEQFGISLDWLILNKGPMYIDEIETAVRENQQRKQHEPQKPVEIQEIEESTNREPVVPPDAMIVTSPEIKELLRFMEDNPVFKFQLLSQFYRYKQDGHQTGEIQFK